MSQMSQPIRILIADDHAVVREGVAAILSLEPDMEVVAQASNGREAVELFQKHRPDLALMDLRMPEMDGVQAITAIRQDFSDARIIVLTTYDGDEDIYRGLRAGARAYLLKAGPREELLDAIRAVHAGQTHIPPDVAAKLVVRMSGRELTARELEVLQLMAAGKSNQEIGGALFVTESTVKAHVNSILSKLNVSDRTQAVTAAIKRGLIHLD